MLTLLTLWSRNDLSLEVQLIVEKTSTLLWENSTALVIYGYKKGRQIAPDYAQTTGPFKLLNKIKPFAAKEMMPTASKHRVTILDSLKA